ncbi:MAG: hypothetical protein JWP89_6473 [Schlesneria sp.]|nr:hypothetical protein [Schlesneria sp.]
MTAAANWREITRVCSIASTIFCLLSLAVILFCPAREIGFTDDSFGIVLVALSDMAMIVAITNGVIAGIAIYAVPKLNSAWLLVGLVQLFVVFFCYPAIQSA